MLVKIICIIVAMLIVLAFFLPSWWYSGLDTQKFLAKYGQYKIYKRIKYFPEKAQTETFYYAKVRVGTLFNLFPIWVKWRRYPGQEISYHIDYSTLFQELEFGFKSYEEKADNWREKFLQNVSDVYQTRMYDEIRNNFNSKEFLGEGEFKKEDK